MPTYDRLVDHLPTLWQPQPGDDTLVAHWLRAVGGVFDGAGADIQHVLRAHWFDTADAAAWATHFAAHRRERGLGALRPRHPGDQREALAYPQVQDLARLAGLLDLPPWRDPASLRESVEGFRQRVADVLDAYRAGIVTPGGLRRLVDAALPEDLAAPVQARRSRYTLEEPVGLRFTQRALTSQPTVPEGDRVAPLARWVLGVPGTPGFVIAGPAVAPMVERYTPTASVRGIGVAYTGTLAADQALQLQPDRQAVVLRGADLLASALDAAPARDASANGPFVAATTLAAGEWIAADTAPDGTLWLLQRDGAAHTVQRWDGTALDTIGTDAPAGPFHALAVAGDSAWLGTDTRLFRCPLWPADGLRRWTSVAAVSGAVRALHVSGGRLFAAGAQGLWELDLAGALIAQHHASLPLRAVWIEGPRTWLATDTALYLVQGAQRWRFAASGPSEEQADWLPSPDGDAEPSPLPTLDQIVRTPDGSLWLGSADGLARWFAAEDGSTRLAAFPDVIAGPVRRLRVDDRGRLWIAADTGLFSFDGRDLAQHDTTAARWLPLGDAEHIHADELSSAARHFWRWEPVLAQWQRFDPSTRRFADPALAVRAAPADAVAEVLHRPALRAALGSFDGQQFTASSTVPADQLRLRVKPDEQRIADGGLPGLPPDAPGASWRYLEMNASPVPPPNLAALNRPWWTTEGQLFLPPERLAAVPGHHRDAASFASDPQGEGQFDRSAFSYPPTARLWVQHAVAPAIGIRIRLNLPDPGQAIDPALADRVWGLVHRARPAGVPLQLMAEGVVLKESLT